MYLDESEQYPFLGVGGFYAELADIPGIEAAWRDMKVALGIGADQELKWTLPQGNRTRVKLERLGRSGRVSIEAAVATITGLPATAVCVIMRELRTVAWRHVLGRMSIRQHYCTGLQYGLQRFAEECVLRRNVEISLCIIDEPGGLRRPDLIPSGWATMRWLVLDRKAAHEMYRNYLSQSIGQGPARRPLPPL